MGNNTTGMDQGRVIDALQTLYENAYVDGQNAPNGYSSNQKRDEQVAEALVSACHPGHAIAGLVILNAEGAKGISFGDEQWETLQVGDVVYSAGMGVGLGQGEPVTLPERISAPGNGVQQFRSLYAVGWNACLDEIAKLGPLYTHADPGEVERLRAASKRQQGVINTFECEVMDLRAQLGQCEAMAAMVAEREWAEHVGTGPVSGKVEAAFTQLHNDLQAANARSAKLSAILELWLDLPRATAGYAADLAKDTEAALNDD